MTGSSASEVSQLLKDWGEGDESALNKLIPLVYEELRKMAHYQMARERAGHTLQTTALVNEVYLRLIGRRGGLMAGSGSFFCPLRPIDASRAGRSRAWARPRQTGRRNQEAVA